MTSTEWLSRTAGAKDSGRASMTGYARRRIGTLTANASQTFLCIKAAPIGGDMNSVISSALLTR